MITNYVVSGMTCNHCVHAVKEEVSNVEGVSEVSVTLDGGRMQVNSLRPIDLADIADAVSEAGDYSVAEL